jgi:dTDP-6-deoxy-L-talose 4-dehydrogenase (NAD+)
MKIVVTGATGFVGAFVARAFVARGHTVRAVYLPNDNTARLDRLASEAERFPLDLHVADEATLNNLLAGQDLCLHAAWYAVPGKYLTAPENIDCLTMSLRLIQAAARHGLRKFVGIGSCAEYDVTAGLLGETTPLQPSTLYAASKASTYLIGQHLAAADGMAFTWCRLFYLYGPFEPTRRLVPDLAINLLKNQAVAVTHGRQIRDFLHIADAAAGIVAAAECETTGAFNIGLGTPVAVREIVETIGALTGRTDLVQWGARAENLLDPPRILADNRKLKQHTTWSPGFSLLEGLRDCITWWKEQPL